MKKQSTTEKVYEIAKPLADELAIVLWDVIFKKEGASWVLRIIIDKPEGINIDDCVDMTHAITPVLDKSDPIAHEYTLEVSSPGINRKLVRYKHFEEFLGAPVKVRLIRPLEDGTKEFVGELITVEQNCDITIKLDEETSVTIEKKEYSSVNLAEDDFA